MLQEHKQEPRLSASVPPPPSKRRVLRAPRRVAHATAPASKSTMLSAASAQGPPLPPLPPPARPAAAFASVASQSPKHAGRPMVSKQPITWRRPALLCDFCGSSSCPMRRSSRPRTPPSPASESHSTPVITCGLCLSTAYCSTACRDVHIGPTQKQRVIAVTSVHSKESCGAVNAANCTLADKLSDCVDGLLGRVVQLALIWLQRNEFIKHWVASHLPLDSGAHPPQKTTTPSAHSPPHAVRSTVRSEFCYVGWMKYVNWTEFVEWASLAILEMQQWAVDAAALFGTNISAEYDSHEHDIQEQKDDSESGMFVTEYRRYGTLRVPNYTLTRIMTSDGQGRAIVVEHRKWGEVLHMHLRPLDADDHIRMRHSRSDMLICVRSNRRSTVDDSAIRACWNFGVEPSSPDGSSATVSSAPEQTTPATPVVRVLAMQVVPPSSGDPWLSRAVDMKKKKPKKKKKTDQTDKNTPCLPRPDVTAAWLKQHIDRLSSSSPSGSL